MIKVFTFGFITLFATIFGHVTLKTEINKGSYLTTSEILEVSEKLTVNNFGDLVFG